MAVLVEVLPQLFEALVTVVMLCFKLNTIHILNTLLFFNYYYIFFVNFNTLNHALYAHIIMLAVTLNQRQCINLTDEQMTRQANAPAKSKELQPNAQSQRFAAHLLLPQPHQHTRIRKTVRTIKKSKVTCETVKSIDEVNTK